MKINEKLLLYQQLMEKPLSKENESRLPLQYNYE